MPKRKSKVEEILKEIATKYKVPFAVDGKHVTFLSRIDNRSLVWTEVMQSITDQFPNLPVEVTIGKTKDTKLTNCISCWNSNVFRYTDILDGSGLRKSLKQNVHVPYSPFTQAGQTVQLLNDLFAHPAIPSCSDSSCPLRDVSLSGEYIATIWLEFAKATVSVEFRKE